MAMRVYELAKKLGMENRVLIPELKKMGVSVTSHSSALDDEIVEKVMGKLAPQSKGQGAASEGGFPSKSISGAGQSSVSPGKSQPVEEPAKPDKDVAVYSGPAGVPPSRAWRAGSSTSRCSVWLKRAA